MPYKRWLRRVHARNYEADPMTNPDPFQAQAFLSEQSTTSPTGRLPGGCYLRSLAEISDPRGNLIVIEGADEHPIKRVYYLFGTDRQGARGFHAHHTLKQLAICVSGACTVLLDDGGQRASVRLSSAGQGLLIAPLVWHEMHEFTPDCVFVVLADGHYDESDYIREYSEFADLVQQRAVIGQ